MNFVVQGITRVARDRRLWPYVIKPVMWGGVLYLALLAIGVLLLRPWLDRAAGMGGNPGMSTLIAVGGWAVFALIWIFLSGVIFLTASSFFAGFVWDKLGERIEIELRGSAPRCPLTQVALFADMSKRMAFAVLIGVLGLLFGWLLPGVSAVVLVGFLALHDFTAGPYLRRGIGFGRQLGTAIRLPGAFGFMIGAGLVAMVPFANVLLFPGLVVGGTMLAVASEDRMRS